MWNLKYDINEHIYQTDSTQMESKLVDKLGVWDYQTQITIYT